MYSHVIDAPASKTTRDDAISMDILKEIPHLTSMIMTRMFNMMVREKRFPESLKTARILALKKPGKCAKNPDSFRPISLLNPLEKLLEEELKSQLVKYFEDEELIPDQHHGGRTGHSTTTAKAVIDKMSADKLEDHEESIILTTDLSKAYDLVDHDLLVKKLGFHG